MPGLAPSLNEEGIILESEEAGGWSKDRTRQDKEVCCNGSLHKHAMRQSKRDGPKEVRRYTKGWTINRRPRGSEFQPPSLRLSVQASSTEALQILHFLQEFFQFFMNSVQILAHIHSQGSPAAECHVYRPWWQNASKPAIPSLLDFRTLSMKTAVIMAGFANGRTGKQQQTRVCPWL